MLNPNDVDLIIFDMDGTILPSLLPFYESVKRAFARLGWPVTFTPEEIKRFFGVSTASVKGSVYEFITPPGSPFSPEEVREKVRAENQAAFDEMAQTYPGVKETLKTLRRRGYKLAQYTNASVSYLNVIMSSLGLRDYYDYVECIEENRLTKLELAKKIRAHFGGANAAIVGDRIHDIEAARASGCLSIGVLFGYGENEPKEADITINKFDDLLTIFDRRLPVFEKIASDIKRKKLADKPFVIGVNGIDCSGKTTFATALEKYLKSKDYSTQIINLDDFHHPKAVRYAGDNPAENYFNKSFDIQTMIRQILVPLREKGTHSVTLKLLDLQTDKYEVIRKYYFNPRTIVIAEGVFLFRKELASYLGYKIFLDIPFSVSRERAGARDTVESFGKYDTKYLPAQRKYLQACSPKKLADMVIDNTRYEFPVIKRHRRA
jgi:phosphoglycolate phosphatase-like HAD superfamily hydrolase/uridine kinase